MRGFTHAVFGLFIGILFDVSAVWLWIPVLFALLPDIDYKKSTLGRYFVLLNFGAEHRGVLHSLLGLIFVSCIWFAVFQYWMLWVILCAYASHLLLDFFNYAGIRLFYPFSFKMKGFCKSGGFIDFLLNAVFCVLIVYILIVKSGFHL